MLSFRRVAFRRVALVKVSLHSNRMLTKTDSSEDLIQISYPHRRRQLQGLGEHKLKSDLMERGQGNSDSFASSSILPNDHST